MASHNPRVFMDIEAGGNPLGRLVFELRDGTFIVGQKIFFGR